jgi:NADH-quinone oxidoreductase subunit E
MTINNGNIDRIIDKHQSKASSLIYVLMEIQHENHWLSKEALKKVSERLQVPFNQVLRIASFYKIFSLVPRGRHEIHVCTGSGCHVRGAQHLLEAVQDLTGIKLGETDPGMKFSLEAGSCSGCCAVGPVIEIDGKQVGKMEPTRVAEVLKNYD